MQITLKNVKIAAFASQETTCFEATLYINGKRAATVANEGCGGPNRFHFTDRALEQRFYDHCKAQPPLPDEGYGPLPMDADLFVSLLLEQLEVQKQYARWCKKKTVFRLPGDPVDQWRTLTIPYSPKAREFIVGKYGDTAEILNETIA